MNTPLIIVSRIEAKPDQVDFISTELQLLLAPTLEEEGCLQYDLHQDNQDPATFIFYEKWESRELWQKHIESDHIQKYLSLAKDAVADSALYEMTKL